MSRWRRWAQVLVSREAAGGGAAEAIAGVTTDLQSSASRNVLGDPLTTTSTATASTSSMRTRAKADAVSAGLSGGGSFSSFNSSGGVGGMRSPLRWSGGGGGGGGAQEDGTADARSKLRAGLMNDQDRLLHRRSGGSSGLGPSGALPAPYLSEPRGMRACLPPPRWRSMGWVGKCARLDGLGSRGW